MHKGHFFHLPVESASDPVSGTAIAGEFWAVHPKKGLLFHFAGELSKEAAASMLVGDRIRPQCNRSEAAARLMTGRLYPDHEVRQIPVVFLNRAVDVLRAEAVKAMANAGHEGAGVGKGAVAKLGRDVVGSPAWKAYVVKAFDTDPSKRTEEQHAAIRAMGRGDDRFFPQIPTMEDRLRSATERVEVDGDGKVTSRMTAEDWMLHVAFHGCDQAVQALNATLEHAFADPDRDPVQALDGVAATYAWTGANGPEARAVAAYVVDDVTQRLASMRHAPGA